MQAPGDPYIACMKNRYPTTEELYVLEHEARRLRALEMARLLRAGASRVRALFNLKTRELGHA